MTQTYEEWGDLLDIMFTKKQRDIYFDWTEERSGQKTRLEHQQKTINKLCDCGNEWRKLTEQAEGKAKHLKKARDKWQRLADRAADEVLRLQADKAKLVKALKYLLPEYGQLGQPEGNILKEVRPLIKEAP